MKQRLEVGLCGSGMFMAGIEASLRQQKRLWITRLGDSLSEANFEISMVRPDVILFEMSAAKQSEVAALLRQYPRSRLIGLELENGTLNTFSISPQAVRSVDELARVILTYADKKHEE